LPKLPFEAGFSSEVSVKVTLLPIIISVELAVKFAIGACGAVAAIEPISTLVSEPDSLVSREARG
jgi:hypothetical protein